VALAVRSSRASVPLRARVTASPWQRSKGHSTLFGNEGLQQEARHVRGLDERARDDGRGVDRWRADRQPTTSPRAFTSQLDPGDGPREPIRPGGPRGGPGGWWIRHEPESTGEQTCWSLISPDAAVEVPEPSQWTAYLGRSRLGLRGAVSFDNAGGPDEEDARLPSRGV